MLDKLARCIALGVLPAQVELTLEVELCTCKRPSVTLRGSSQSYVDKFKALEDEVRRNMHEWDIHMRRSRGKPRIGAFEISLIWTHNSFSYKVLLYSKLSSRLWPNVGAFVANLSCVLPRPTEQVAVKVVSDSSHRPIADAHIVIQHPDTNHVIHSAYTDQSGTATILAKEGMYAVIVSAQGHTTEEALLTLSNREELPIRMTATADCMNSLSASEGDPSFEETRNEEE